MPGPIAWFGLTQVGQPKPEETVVIFATLGTVGSVVGQLAKFRECRAIGIAGGRAKCAYVVQELGFDACIDYKVGQIAEASASAAPQSIDISLDHVGSEILDTVLEQLNQHLCTHSALRPCFAIECH